MIEQQDLAPLEDSRRGRVGRPALLGIVGAAVLLASLWLTGRLPDGPPAPDDGKRVAGLGLSAVVPPGWEPAPGCSPATGIELTESAMAGAPGATARTLAVHEVLGGGSLIPEWYGGRFGQELSQSESVIIESRTAAEIPDQATATYRFRVRDTGDGATLDTTCPTAGNGGPGLGSLLGARWFPAGSSWLLTPIVVEGRTLVATVEVTPREGLPQEAKSAADIQRDYAAFVASLRAVPPEPLGVEFDLPAGWTVAREIDATAGLQLEGPLPPGIGPDADPGPDYLRHYLHVYPVQRIFNRSADRFEEPRPATADTVVDRLRSDPALTVDELAPVSVGGQATTRLTVTAADSSERYSFGSELGIPLIETAIPLGQARGAWDTPPGGSPLNPLDFFAVAPDRPQFDGRLPTGPAIVRTSPGDGLTFVLTPLTVGDRVVVVQATLGAPPEVAGLPRLSDAEVLAAYDSLVNSIRLT